jgi:hypothetical protein
MLERLNVYSAHRSLPAGGSEARLLALEKTLKVLTARREPLTGPEIEEIQLYSRLTGQEIRMCCKEADIFRAETAHCSISNSGCYEESGKTGGKFSWIRKKFHNEWLLCSPEEDEEVKLPIGVTVVFYGGIPRWMARIDGHECEADGRQNFGTSTSEGWLYPKRAGCSERRLGNLLHVWSFLSLLRDDYIDKSGSWTGKPFPARMTAVGEPGGKVRVPTITLCALITYLQPFQHIMTGLLECDPTLRAGLRGAHQAFEYTKRLVGLNTDSEYILLGDLEDATNWISHEVGLIHFAAFFEGFRTTNQYLVNCPSIICSKLLLEYDGEIYLTQNGCPMGLPGVKGLLHSMGKAINKCAEASTVAARPFILKRSKFGNAGDDIVKIGETAKLEAHEIAASETYKVRPSKDKWGLYEVGGPYCETMLQNNGIVTLNPENLVDPRNSFIVDAPRPRLFSAESKGRSDEDTNPIFGKGRQLGKELTWSPERWHLPVAFMFIYNMRDYGDYRQLMALPTPYGGWGFPMPHSVRIAWMGTELCEAVNYVFRHKQTKRATQMLWALSKLTGPLLYERGEPVREIEEDPVYDLLYDYQGQTLEEIELSESLPLRRNARRVDRRRRILQRGFTSMDRLRQPLVPYWKRKRHPEKGWKTAPLIKRFEAFIRVTPPDYQDEKIDGSPVERVLSTPLWELREDEKFLPKDLAVWNHDLNQTEILNIGAIDMGISLSLCLPNEHFII